MVFTLPAANSRLPLPLFWPPLKLYVREQGKQYFPVMNLVRVQAEANYSWLHWADGRRLLMPRTLKWYLDQLPPAHFIRFHRNCVVNRHYIRCLERSPSGLVAHLTTGETLAISRRRWTSVRRQLQTSCRSLD